MAKHFKEETGKSDAYSLIGEVVRYYKNRAAKIWAIVFSVIGVILFLVGLVFIVEEDSYVWEIILMVVGVVLVAVSLGIYYPLINRRKNMDLEEVGKKVFEKDIASLETTVDAINKKKFGNKDYFKSFERTDKLVYLSKHMTEVKILTQYPDGASYTVTLDNGITEHLIIDYYDYGDFITGYYLNYRIRKNANQQNQSYQY